MKNFMTRALRGLVLQVVMPLAVLGAAQGTTPATTRERWLHVKVTGDPDGEVVRVNLPLSVAEKVLPAINTHELHAGRVTLHDTEINGFDLRALAEAVRSTPDSELVRVEDKEEAVHVKKENGNLLVTVRGKHKGQENVDVKVPLPVVAALLSGPKDELDVLAAVKALEAYGDMALVTVQDGSQNVRIWVDSSNTAE
jgi:hypothetical protein